MVAVQRGMLEELLQVIAVVVAEVAVVHYAVIMAVVADVIQSVLKAVDAVQIGIPTAVENVEYIVKNLVCNI